MSLILKTMVDSVAQWKDVSPYAKSLAQATAGNQPTIHTTSPWGPPQYDFDGAADPNSDHFFLADTWFRSIDALPVTVGSLLVWFTPDVFTTEMFLAGSCTNGADSGEFWLGMDGTVANDPMEIVLRVAGVNTYQGRFAASLTNADKNFAAITSDGSVLRAYFNGDPAAITDIVGANAGQWFASAVAATAFCAGALRRATQVLPFNGKMPLVVMYNSVQPGGEIKKVWESGYTMHGPRYLPKE
jgi:hypothetical protein